MIEPRISAPFLILDKKEYKYRFEGDKLKCASRTGRNLPSSHWRSVVFGALFSCVFSHVHSATSEKYLKHCVTTDL